MTLQELEIGQSARIVTVGGEGALREYKDAAYSHYAGGGSIFTGILSALYALRGSDCVC